MDNLGLRVIKNAEIEGKLNVGSGATISGSLRIPLAAPATRDVGDIWYDPNITSPGGTSVGGGDIGKQVTVIQHTPNEVDLYDGSTRVATFKMDNSVDKIVYDSSTKTIKVPNGVILANILDSNSITLEKNGNANSLKISVKEAYISGLINQNTQSILSRLAIAEESISQTNQSLLSKIEENKNSINETISNISLELNTKFSTITEQVNTFEEQINNTISNSTNNLDTRITNNTNYIDQAYGSINELTDQLSSYNQDLDYLYNRCDEIIERLNNIDGEEGNLTKVVADVANLQSQFLIANKTIEDQKTQIINLQATVEVQNASLIRLESRVTDLERKLT